MKFDYTFPAMTTAVPHGCRTPRNVLVELSASVDVPEYSGAYAPLACVIDEYDEIIEFRHCDRGFYSPVAIRATKPTRPNDLQPGAANAISFRMMTEIAVELGLRRETVEPSEALNHLSTLRGDLGNWMKAGRPYQEYTRQPSMRPLFMDMSQLGQVDADPLEDWGKRAAALASEMFLLDGQLWVRVPEPVFELRAWGESRRTHLRNLDLYQARDHRLLPLPRPFGRWDTCDGTYWAWHSSIYPLTELDELRVRSGRNQFVEMFMPETFGLGFAELELDRQARLAVSRARIELFEGSRWLKHVPQTLRGAYHEIRRAFDEIDRGIAVEGLDDRLETFAQAWRAHDHLSVFDKEGLATVDMERAVARWRDRPISLEVEPPVSVASPTVLR